MQTLFTGLIALCSIVLLYRNYQPKLDIGRDGLVHLWYNRDNLSRSWKYLGDWSNTWIHNLILKYRRNKKWKNKF